MIVRTVMEVKLGDDRKVYVDSKVYNAIRHEGYVQGKADAIDDVIKLARAEIDFESQAEQKRFVEFMESLKEKKNE